MDQGFFLAQRQEDGSPGRPIGNDDAAIMLFDDLANAVRVRDGMLAECGPLGIFKLNVVLVGEVVVV